jgi:hypothetical protein
MRPAFHEMRRYAAFLWYSSHREAGTSVILSTRVLATWSDLRCSEVLYFPFARLPYCGCILYLSSFKPGGIVPRMKPDIHVDNTASVGST